MAGHYKYTFRGCCHDSYLCIILVASPLTLAPIHAELLQPQGVAEVAWHQTTVIAIFKRNYIIARP